MRLFRLEPTYLDDPQWQASSVVETVWVAAATPARARQLVAEQTFAPVAAGPRAATLPSPWLSDSLTKCVPEKWVTDVPAGTLMLANDPRVTLQDDGQ
jgi:hypothetical protein